MKAHGTNLTSKKPPLPSGWHWVTLGDVTESMKNGIYRPASSYSDDGIPCLRMYNIDQGKIVWRDIKRMTLTEDEIEEYELLPGDLLVNRVNSRELVGKTVAIPSNFERCVFESKNIRVRLRCDIVVPEYVCYRILAEGSRYFMQNAQQVVGMASINQSQVASFPLPLASINEQRRIVAEIEKHFTRLDAGVATLHRVQVNLKHYRAAVLKAACEGGLVSRIAKWHFKHLSDVSVKIGSGSTPRGGSSVYRDSGTPLIRSMNVHSTGFRFDGLVFIDETEANRLKNVTVVADDVLLNITGASIGRVTTAPQSVDGARVNQHVCIIRPKSDLLPKFLALFLASPKQQLCIANVQVGATRQALTKSMIMNWKVPIPSLAEQTLIVEEVERRLSVIDGMESVVSTNLQRAKHVRQGILNKAFARELTEPDSNDEPADQLLVKMLESQQKNYKAMPKDIIKRIESPKTIRVRSVLEVLTESAEGHTPEALFAECGRDSTRIEEVEEFFAELRDLHESKQIIEVRKDASTVFLQAVP